jgi:hypothetical protein
MYSVRIRKTSRVGKNELQSYEYRILIRKRFGIFYGKPQEAMNNRKFLGAAPGSHFLFIHCFWSHGFNGQWHHGHNITC